MRIDRELLELFEHQEIILFVGSNLSVYAGLPTGRIYRLGGVFYHLK